MDYREEISRFTNRVRERLDLIDSIEKKVDMYNTAIKDLRQEIIHYNTLLNTKNISEENKKIIRSAMDEYEGLIDECFGEIERISAIREKAEKSRKVYNSAYSSAKKILVALAMMGDLAGR